MIFINHIALAPLANGLDDALAVMSLPEKYRRRLATTNIAGEAQRRDSPARERAIRIFPKEVFATRFIGAMLAKQHEIWSTGKKMYTLA